MDAQKILTILVQIWCHEHGQELKSITFEEVDHADQNGNAAS